MSMNFKTLRIEGWRQFDGIEIELHPRLTILTGANGAGKSSIMRIFSRHFGFDRPFLSTPTAQKTGGYTYFTGVFQSFSSLFKWRKPDVTTVGVLSYTNGVEAQLHVPVSAGVQYNISISNQQGVPGIHIDSHQPVQQFQQVGTIPTNLLSPSVAYSLYNNELVQKYSGGHTGFSPAYRMKEAIISMAMFGQGNSFVQGNEEIFHAYTGFIDILHKILPESLGFVDLAVRPPEVVLVTNTGDFLLDASSGGVMTLIDLSWRLYLFSLSNSHFVVTMDEPENHLHPTMQRSLMRKLLLAFPTAQFIIATHSPFMVSAVKDSTVYVLRYRNVVMDSQTENYSRSIQGQRVYSERLDTVNKAGSASDILREVLGVSATMPEWVEDGLAQIVARYRDIEIDTTSLKRLRSELKELGYEELYPDALSALTAGR